MLNNKSFIYIILFNIFLILIWDLIVVIFCKSINESNFYFHKKMYKTKDWEKNGLIYTQKFKIKKWKDFLPQYVSKNGFSKKNLDDLSVKYIDMFILETCRGEWAHRKCLFVLVPMFIFNKLSVFFLLFIFVLFLNVPYILIQRYNRIRLLKIRQKIESLNDNIPERIFSIMRKFNAVDS